MIEAPFFADIAEGPAGGRAFWARADDGVRVRFGVWRNGTLGTVLLFPGRTEFVEKYGPAAADLAQRGFATVAIDWRGQGLADRLLSAAMTGHVARFADYQRDLRAVLAALVPLNLPQPMYLLAHSMGAAIGLRALAEGLPVRAAAFTGPMWGIRISTAMRPVAWTLAAGAQAGGLGHVVAPGTTRASYVATAPFQGNVLTTDPAMFGWMKRQLVAHPELALGGPSMVWLIEALRDCRRLLALPAPGVPALTILGGAERIVDVSAVRALVAKWPGARLEEIAGAEHEVMMETPAIRTRTFDLIADHFRPTAKR